MHVSYHWSFGLICLVFVAYFIRDSIWAFSIGEGEGSYNTVESGEIKC